MFGLDTQPLGHDALRFGSGSGAGGAMRSFLQMVPALKIVQFFTSHLPKGFAVEIATHPPCQSIKKMKQNEIQSLKVTFIT